MSDTTISVRGEAVLTVPPDRAVIHAQISVRDPEQVSGLDRLTVLQAEVIDVLSGLGGVPQTGEPDDVPLSWVIRSVTTHPIWNKADTPSGWLAEAALSITASDAAIAGEVVSALGRIADVSIGSVEWEIARTNPAWAQVRTEAVREALVRARDYAAALGGTVTGLLHLSDPGLLGGGAERGGAVRAMALSGRATGQTESDIGFTPGVLSVQAVVEARFSASVDLLP